MISRIELRRNMFHIAVGTAFLCLLYLELLSLKSFTAILMCGAVVYLINIKKPLPIIKWFIDNYERSAERKTPGRGALLLVFGIYIAYIIYPKNIALAAISILTFGDAVAPLIGHMGRLRHPLSKTKLVEGHLAGMLAGMLVAMLFVKPFEAFIASFFAMTLETYEVKLHPKAERINDNLVIPVAAGIAILVLRVFVS